MSVYFSGTDGSIKNGWTQISTFASLTDALDITDLQIPLEVSHYKLAFDGCGVTYGMAGTIFGYGLKHQCQKVSQIVHFLINSSFKVKLNCLGLSRGAVAIMLLVKMLAKIPKTQLEMNILLFDPVPGNMIITSTLDIINNSLANQAMDLTASINLNNVLALYPYIPLPDIALHAPLIPNYPASCQLEEDVTLGCHQGALFDPTSLETQLSFLRIRSFLEANGTILHNYNKYISEQECLTQLEAECKLQKPSIRHTHSKYSALIIRELEGDYLNLQHIQLRKKFRLPVVENYKIILQIRKRKHRFINRAILVLGIISFIVLYNQRIIIGSFK